MAERAASWFAIVLVAAVLATSYWYSQTLRLTPGVQTGRIGAVDFFAQNIALTGFDSLGRARYRLFADRMTHFGNSDDVDLDNPRILSLRADQPQVEATALQAHASNNAQTVQMSGNVVITRAAAPDREAMRMETEDLSAIPDEDHFWTDDPVRLQSGASVINARGMDFDNIARRVELLSDVVATFPPRRSP
ncbi:MAG TPA: LPS export ABC transporter periplasmic protein LptC [Burkholderiaceae bacterium]|nr:LPS export ABC transporter periplasmic protein LptC [Burkholderiaceae bacterium]